MLRWKKGRLIIEETKMRSHLVESSFFVCWWFGAFRSRKLYLLAVQVGLAEINKKGKVLFKFFRKYNLKNIKHIKYEINVNLNQVLAQS